MRRTMVFLMDLAETHLDRVRSVAPDWEIVAGRDSSVWSPYLKQAEIVGGWSEAAVREVLKPDSALKWIHHWGAGVDRYPFETLQEKGVILTRSSGVHAYPISETIFAMLLAFTRNIHLYVRNQMANRWQQADSQAELHEKTLGILGVGAIGEETARIAQAFRMRVLGFRRSGKPARFVDEMFDREGLHHVLQQSDFIVNTLPLTEETKHLISQEQLSMMKPSAFFVNIGRGGTVDTEALIDALAHHRIAGAGLDAFEDEPLPEESPLWEMDNVIITPHASGGTPYYDDRVLDIFIPNLQDYIAGRTPSINVVDLEKQY